MSQQKPDPAQPRPRRATAKSKTPTSNGPQPQEKLPAWPAPDDREGWKIYWEERQQPWRTEPEVGEERQKFLTERRAITPSIEKSVYPFKNIKLSRTDVEWLVATHDEGKRSGTETIVARARGLDLRGADLRGTDLRRLPLHQLRGGLEASEWFLATPEQRETAAIHLEEADLNRTDLSWAVLRSAHLEGANLRYARLEGAQLRAARLGGTVTFPPANMQRASLSHDTNLEDITLGDNEYGCVWWSDIHWGEVNLAVVDWSSVKMSGEEKEARRSKGQQGETKATSRRLAEYLQAVRANRQLAVVLQAQGLNENAARFAYRANVLQSRVLWFQMVQPRMLLWQRVRKLGAWVFSHLLNLMAGYGYRPERSFLAYLLVIFGFMGLYLLTGHFTTPHLRWDEALVLSLSSFHGRGFFSQTITLGDAYARLAVIEAVLGLFIEISFIATFTQRFFGK